MTAKAKCTHSATIVSQFFKKPSATGIRNFGAVAAYFMYDAPNIDCAHSTGKITGELAENVFKKMISTANMDRQYKVLEKIRDSSWNEYNLADDTICMQCSRMTYSRFKREDNLTALLRHIRNSFAHGLIYVKKFNRDKSAYLMLEDKDAKKRTARIILSFKQLETWKALLEENIATGE